MIGTRREAATRVVVCLCVTMTCAAIVGEAAAGQRGDVARENRVMTTASGAFEVALRPLETSDTTEGSLLGRMSLDKQFHGDLEAIGKGEMLTAGTSVSGSAGYVAIERVTGTLRGRKGGFVLQHTGTMARGVPSLSITVVPDSGTGELEGLSGTMAITVANRTHTYEMIYTFGDPR